MLRTVVFAVLVTLCYGTTVMPDPTATMAATTDMMPDPSTNADIMTTEMADMTSSAAAMTSSMANVVPIATQEPPVVTYAGVRRYRDEDYFQAIYSDGTYQRTRSARLLHFNVSIYKILSN